MTTAIIILANCDSGSELVIHAVDRYIGEGGPVTETQELTRLQHGKHYQTYCTDTRVVNVLEVPKGAVIASLAVPVIISREAVEALHRDPTDQTSTQAQPAETAADAGSGQGVAAHHAGTSLQGLGVEEVHMPRGGRPRLDPEDKLRYRRPQTQTAEVVETVETSSTTG